MGRLSRLVRKELSEILRERRTILTMLLMPLLVYPLLGIAFQQHFMASKLASRKQPTYHIGFTSKQQRDLFWRQMDLGDNLLRDQDPALAHKSALQLEPHILPDPEEKVKAGLLDLGVLGVRHTVKGKDLGLEYKAIYQENLGVALAVLEYVERRLAAANGAFLETRLGVPRNPPVQYVRLVREPLPAPEAQAVSLGALIPLILILMTITGAVYPAIDLTAGERERGTLEILMAAPVPRLGLLFGKYVTVFTIAVLTALVNLLSMLATLLISRMGALLPGGGELSVILILQVLGLLLLFAAFFSGVVLAITSAARSFKEAQAYLIPLMLMALTPGVLGMIPGLQLEGPLLVTPLVNIVLLARDLFEGQASGARAAIVVASTMLYSAAALAVAARIFGAEAVLFSEQRSWSDLWRRPAEPRAEPTLANALLCLAMMFPGYFLLRGLLLWIATRHAAQHPTEPPTLDPLVGLVVMGLGSIVLFVGFPIISAWWNRVSWRTGFQLRGARPASLLGGVVLGCSLWPVVLEALALLKPILMPHEEDLKELAQAASQARNQYPGVMVLAIVVQALAEEWFFRGYLFTAFKARTGPWLTILGSAVSFGFFHLVATGSAAFVSSAALGIVLGWLAWQSRSLWPPMLMHALHNGILNLVALSETDLRWSWVIAGGVGVAAGLGLMKLWGAHDSAAVGDRDS